MQMAERPLGRNLRMTENNMEINHNGNMKKELKQYKKRKKTMADGLKPAVLILTLTTSCHNTWHSHLPSKANNNTEGYPVN